MVSEFYFKIIRASKYPLRMLEFKYLKIISFTGFFLIYPFWIDASNTSFRKQCEKHRYLYIILLFCYTFLGYIVCLVRFGERGSHGCYLYILLALCLCDKRALLDYYYYWHCVLFMQARGSQNRARDWWKFSKNV